MMREGKERQKEVCVCGEAFAFLKFYYIYFVLFLFFTLLLKSHPLSPSDHPRAPIPLYPSHTFFNIYLLEVLPLANIITL